MDFGSRIDVWNKAWEMQLEVNDAVHAMLDSTQELAWMGVGMAAAALVVIGFLGYLINDLNKRLQELER